MAAEPSETDTGPEDVFSHEVIAQTLLETHGIRQGGTIKNRAAMLEALNATCFTSIDVGHQRLKEVVIRRRVGDRCDDGGC
ncbi:hypothetical protein EYF80_062431 [Liparis tanakae]|uniref:Uncharacterized protein n=1 Tax=Liparis tanakae TaxID=230148 RepID=A0A4Z2EG28_9TELE|nr:hypothetical protein EYF80_062431 [Liparis tanakae]